MTAVDEAIRREAIADYGVIGEAPASSLEGLLRIAASVCRVEKAVVNIIDDRFQHQIAALGFDAAVCAREDSMCAAVYLSGQQVVLPDARDDERFTDNPFVTGELGRVRFYASSPLRTPDGVIIGTLCVFDDDVAELDAAQRSTMDILAGQVVDVLELRRAGRELRSSNDRLSTFAGQVSHDLRNPLTALVGYIELASDSLEDDQASQAVASLARAEAAAGRMTDLVGDLLSYARIGGAARHFGPVSVRDAAIAAVGRSGCGSPRAGRSGEPRRRGHRVRRRDPHPARPAEPHRQLGEVHRRRRNPAHDRGQHDAHRRRARHPCRRQRPRHPGGRAGARGRA